MKISNQNIPVSKKNDPTIAPEEFGTFKTSEKFPIRDPFILLYGDTYYLYRSAAEKGVTCFVSKDLENWSAPVTVYEVPENFHGYDCFFWAPEVHYYKGAFYMFTSVKSSKFNNHRVISVYKAANPLGPFEDIAGGCITPKNWDSIDGTLYIDENEEPNMVFVHEWTSLPDHVGTMAYAKLSEDFTHFVTEPKEIFKANEPIWAAMGVTDGPYLVKNSNGALNMIWSNFWEKGYEIAISHSESGKLEGPWKHQSSVFYGKDVRPEWKSEGGHAMIFETAGGKYLMTFHGPNSKENGDYEHLRFVEIAEEGDNIIII